jgi:hypothetical protein
MPLISFKKMIPSDSLCFVRVVAGGRVDPDEQHAAPPEFLRPTLAID